MNTLLLTVAEAAEECRVSEGFIEKEIREERLAVRKLGRLTRIERSELQRWISAQPTKNEGTTPGQYGSPVLSGASQVLEKTVSGDRQGRRGRD